MYNYCTSSMKCPVSWMSKESKTKLLRSFQPEHNPPSSALNPNPWLTDGEWYQPQTDCFKGSHKCLWCMCLFFKVQNNNNNYNYNNNCPTVSWLKKKKKTAETGASSFTSTQNKMAVDHGYINHHVVEKYKNYLTIGWSFSKESCQIHLTLISHSQK